MVWYSLLVRGVRRLPPLFNDAVWLSLPRANGRVSPSRSKVPTPTVRQNEKEEKGGKEMRNELQEKNTYSRYQIIK